MPTRILASYVLRVVVADGRWCLEVRDVRGGAVATFDAFDALGAHLEQLAREGGVGRGAEPEGGPR